MTVARRLGNSSGRREKEAVLNMADPTPSVILSRIQKRINTQPLGIMAVKLCVTTRRKDTYKSSLQPSSAILIAATVMRLVS